MKALVIIAHGSKLSEANKEIAILTENVRQKAKDKFAMVEYSFLELASPDLKTVVEKLVHNNVTDITVVPYFLNSGKHVTIDIPALVSAAREKYPDCTFKLSLAIGLHKEMVGLILDAANQAYA